MLPSEATLAQLRRDALLGMAPSEMLRTLEKNYPGGRTTMCKIVPLYKGFRVPLTNLLLIGGWSREGTGSITDARIDDELGAAIATTRELWEPLTDVSPESTD